MQHGVGVRVRLIFSRMAAVWKQVRKPVIGCYVLAHFVFGLLCFLPHPCVLWEMPGVERITQAYDVADLAQTWRMFAPPSQCHYEIGYSLKFKDGWTKMLFLESILEEEGTGRIVLPRGYLRLSTHLRHPSLRQQPLHEQPFFFSLLSAA